LQRGGERLARARHLRRQRLGHVPAQLDAFLEMRLQVRGEIHGSILSGFESAAQPFAHAVAFQRHDVEAARRLALQAREEVARGRFEAQALAPIDARRGAAEARARAQAHLDEHERLALARDEIDLAHARAIVARHELQAFAHEEARGRLLGGAARGLCRGSPSARLHGARSGTTWPPSTSAGMRVRSNALPGPRVMRPVTPSSGALRASPRSRCSATRYASMPKA